MRELVCVRLRTENFVASRTYMNDKRLALKIINLIPARFSETAAYLEIYGGWTRRVAGR